MGRPIRSITLKGYKSIQSLEDFAIHDLNVLIGANGAGKSNFVGFFYLLREIIEGRLEKAVNVEGGADTQLHLGPKVTEQIECTVEFGPNEYVFKLQPTADDRLIFADERIKYEGTPGYSYSVNRSLGTGHSESKLKFQIDRDTQNKAICEHIYSSISSWTVYHVHDTSITAGMRRACSVGEYERLRPDASNLAPFLNFIKEDDEPRYELIVDTIKLVAPFFKEFRFRPKKAKEDEKVLLEWVQEGTDYPFHPSQLSDGTLRFIALATALLQPDPPTTILIDEPELGLHPFALEMLGHLILQARQRTQLIISTQSALLLNVFDPEDVVIVERTDGATSLRRLEEDELTSWMQEYTLGELWQKNVYGGGPVHE